MTMNRSILAFVITFLVILNLNTSIQGQEKIREKPFGIVIHGGAGNISKEKIPAEILKEYHSKLKEALTTGYHILEKGGKSLDAVEAAIRTMEDAPLFNAGKGAVFTGDETNELDASIMDGKTLNAGAVSGVKHIKNPISLARLVMEHSRHVMLTGDGAETYAKQMGMQLVSGDYFFTKRRWESLQRARQRKINDEKDHKDKKSGTVGAVALDRMGNLAAGTSTGGMTNKKYGRVGDSPIIGAGTYANNRTCAVSATGHGEYFIRSVVTYDISALMEYKGFPLKKAAQTAIYKVEQMGGFGGVIAIDYHGNIAMPFNTSGMFRGYMGHNGKFFIKIFKESI